MNWTIFFYAFIGGFCASCLINYLKYKYEIKWMSRKKDKNCGENNNVF